MVLHSLSTFPIIPCTKRLANCDELGVVEDPTRFVGGVQDREASREDTGFVDGYKYANWLVIPNVAHQPLDGSIPGWIYPETGPSLGSSYLVDAIGCS